MDTELLRAVARLRAPCPRAFDVTIELRAAARRVHTARKRLAPPSVAPTRLRDRYLPHRFMAKLAVIFVLALIPAFGISIYDEIHGRSNTRALLRRDAAADAGLASAAERQVILGGQRLLAALSQVPQSPTVQTALRVQASR